MDDSVRLVAIRDTPLDVAEVIAAVEDDAHGAVATFIGVVRDRDSGKDVNRLEYSAHPTAVDRLSEICEAVAEKYDVLVAAVHRIGMLDIGDLAVVVATSSGHRAESFDATRELIDVLKKQVPIWKHQAFTDGTQEWMATPE